MLPNGRYTYNARKVVHPQFTHGEHTKKGDCFNGNDIYTVNFAALATEVGKKKSSQRGREWLQLYITQRVNTTLRGVKVCKMLYIGMCANLI